MGLQQFLDPSGRQLSLVEDGAQGAAGRKGDGDGGEAECRGAALRLALSDGPPKASRYRAAEAISG
ncbi:hypothetical protein [Streptomyces sp. Ncost-T10-10d]|uniref:hypothetical protein n=1 Tax=Streptomyces sp. Ncost-T10-10d TaxID=1839774 RepID=UPI00159F3060|nr:hypothetical protein [Streptomyces sp. Ncost-T10-10d]